MYRLLFVCVSVFLCVFEFENLEYEHVCASCALWCVRGPSASQTEKLSCRNWRVSSNEPRPMKTSRPAPSSAEQTNTFFYLVSSLGTGCINYSLALYIHLIITRNVSHSLLILVSIHISFFNRYFSLRLLVAVAVYRRWTPLLGR